MKQFWTFLLALWGSISVFSQTDFYDDFSGEDFPNVISSPYDFAPDADSSDVEVAPLDVNSKDEDVPYPLRPDYSLKQLSGEPEQIVPTDVLQPEE